jgi:Flp pilus assembly protein TadB
VNDRARGRGRKIDELLPIALSRIATGLQVTRGLDETLEEVAQSLLSEGPNPLSPELLKTAKDIRTKNADQALRALASRSPSLSLANVAMLLESYQRAGGGQYADVVSDTARAVQHIIAVRNHAQAKASQPLGAARMVPAMLGIVLLVMMNDPMTRESFQHPVVQIVLALAIGVMVLGYLVMRNDVLKVV